MELTYTKTESQAIRVHQIYSTGSAQVLLGHSCISVVRRGVAVAGTQAMQARISSHLLAYCRIGAISNVKTTVPPVVSRPQDLHSIHLGSFK